jgi:hypothetical protein
MIPEYCYDCMNRQISPTQTPGSTGTMHGPTMQGMPMQGLMMPGMYQTAVPGQMTGMFQPPVSGQMQPPFQAPLGVPGQMGQMPQQMPFQQAPQVGFQLEQGPDVQRDIGYTQGWLRTQIGRRVKVEFLIGTNMFIDRDGTLLDVGISYILMREAETDDILMADIFSIKFVRVYY